MADQHKIVTDRLNTFFTNNKIQIATSAPTSGSYIVGDIVIKSNQKADTNVGWICTVAGAPGTWVEFGVGAGHTHNYAGSSSVGGAANSVKTNLAIKLNGGSTEGTNLFTFNGSTAKTINITPSSIGAAAASHGTHLDLGTTSTTAYRGDYGNTAYTHSQAAHAPSNAQKNSDITKAEIEAKLTGDITTHTHSYAGSSSAGGAANSVKTNLAIKLNGGTTEGTDLFTFNGSTAKTINITPSSIGAAASSHMGTLSSLKTTDKSNLVAAINEVFQSGNNAKQKLVDALVAKGQSCSTSESWDILIGKIGNIITEPHVILEAGFKNGYSMINYSSYATSGALGINLRTGTTSRAVYTSISPLIDFSKYKKLSITIYKNDATGSANYWYIATGSSAVSGLARDEDNVKQRIGTIISETTVNYNSGNDCHVINVDLSNVNTTSYLQIARVSPVSEERTATVIRIALS